MTGTRNVLERGFNLLPWRQIAKARARRRRVAEWLGAALLGCGCSALAGGWQMQQRASADSERGALERTLAGLRAPLAEHDRLTSRVLRQREQAESVPRLARPLTHLFDLLAALAHAEVAHVGVQQITHGAAHTTVLAHAESESAVSGWLDRIRAVADVRDAAIVELKRAPSSPQRDAASAPAALQLTARVNWADSATEPRATRGQR